MTDPIFVVAQATTDIERVTPPFVEIKLTTHYRGKTNCYVVNRNAVRTILDREGKRLALEWQADWHEIAHGVAICLGQKGTRSSVGGRSREEHVTGLIRIWPQACPVYLQFECVYEVNDYDDAAMSSRESSTRWVCYAE